MESSTNKANTNKPKLHVSNIFWLAFVHVIALLAIPFFSWEGLVVCLVGLFIITPMGINLGYHRLVTHRGFKVPQWLEYAFVTLGAALGGGPPMHWVAEHRLHHRFSDKGLDPHNAGEGFWHSHIGHLFYHKDFEDIEEQWMKYVPDMNSHAYYRVLNKYWIILPFLLLPPLYALGGWNFVLWGGVVRIVLMLHITWFVNSASHLFGYRNYDTPDHSRNCWWVGLLAAGEGWHNNHHFNPVSAAHGHKWWEVDFTFQIIRGLEIVGLATNVALPSRKLLVKVETVNPVPSYVD
jgi:fatty-acid desaturase